VDTEKFRSFNPRVIFTEGFNVTDNPVMVLMNIITQRQLTAETDFNNPGQKQNFLRNRKDA
jgi:hypothetical protein